MRCPLPSFNADTIQGFWQIPINYISVNGTAISSDLTDALIDSGSASIIGDTKSISSIYSRIPGSVQIPQSFEWTGTHVAGLPVGVANLFTRK